MSGGMEMDLLTSAAGAMSAQRTVLDIAARNVAAAQASTPGHPYARLVADVAAPAGDAGDGTSDARFDPDADAGPAFLDAAASGAEPGVRVRSEPGSGDALSEMIAVLDAQRAYEQNASIFDVAKRLAERTIDIGRT
jgi:flagellar basal body rod protein FlgC